MTLSLWQQRIPAPERIDTCVAIIGAGITGLSAAIECQARNIPCVILEAEYPASKASGRNAGYLMRGAAENYAAAINDLGRDRARFLWRWTEQNLLQLRALGIESVPSFNNRPSCLVATEEAEAAQLEHSAELLREDSFEVELIRAGINAPDDAIFRSGRSTLALLNPSDATCSPTELVAQLQRQLTDTPILTNAPVHDIQPSTNHITLSARAYTVRAKHVLAATNAYARHLLPELEGVVTPNRGQMLAFRPADPALADLAYAYYLNHGSEYIRPGAKGEIILGGARKSDETAERTDHDAVSDTVQSTLEHWIRALITTDYEVTARWSGIMGFTNDAMPIVKATTLDHRVWFCGGLTGHGMSMGHITARHAITTMLDKAPNPFDLNPDNTRPQPPNGAVI